MCDVCLGVCVYSSSIIINHLGNKIRQNQKTELNKRSKTSSRANVCVRGAREKKKNLGSTGHNHHHHHHCNNHNNNDFC